jgi:DNA-binding beta-propeller fold protein YncE
MKHLTALFLRRRWAAFRYPLVGLLLLAQVLGGGRAVAVDTITVKALKSWAGETDANNASRFSWITQGIAVSPLGEVYVLRTFPTSRSLVEQFNLEGVFAKSWGAPDFKRPYGIAVDAITGDVYVADPGGNYPEGYYKQVEKFDRTGKLLKIFGRSGTGNGEFKNPTCIAVGRNHMVYVGDSVACNVQEFNANGDFKARWKTERAPGLPLNPQGIAVGPGDDVYVVGAVPEKTSKNLLIFSASGTLLRSYNTRTPDRVGNYQPQAVAVNGIGLIVIADSSDAHLQVFTPTGEYLRAVAVDINGETGPLSALAFYHDDYLYVANRSRNAKIRLF